MNSKEASKPLPISYPLWQFNIVIIGKNCSILDSLFRASWTPKAFGELIPRPRGVSGREPRRAGSYPAFVAVTTAE